MITANARVLDDRPLGGPYAGRLRGAPRALATLRASELDWTVVATPMLTDESPAGTYEATVDAKGDGSEIDRADFARAMVDALDHHGWAGHTVDVTT